MDYSLLVGLHFRETSAAGDLISSEARTPTGHFSLFHKIAWTMFWISNLCFWLTTMECHLSYR